MQPGGGNERGWSVSAAYLTRAPQGEPPDLRPPRYRMVSSAAVAAGVELVERQWGRPGRDAIRQWGGQGEMRFDSGAAREKCDSTKGKSLVLLNARSKSDPTIHHVTITFDVIGRPRTSRLPNAVSAASAHLNLIQLFDVLVVRYADTPRRGTEGGSRRCRRDRRQLS
ncbi:hypothetical protein MRB53_041988 [Persea americana]|nr:hypothetical protein MRB53_041988 [Persea americana]